MEGVLTAVDHLYRTGFRLVDGWKWGPLWVCKWSNGVQSVRGIGPSQETSLAAAANLAGLRGLAEW